jgi:hypothetical protein
LLLAGLFAQLGFLAPIATAADGGISGGYLTDSQGRAVKNAFGSCFRTGYWTPALATYECDPEYVPVAPAAAAPPPPPPPPPPRPAPIPAAKPAGKPPAKEFPTVSIEREGWAPLEQVGAEKADFGLYTYVLFGYDPTAKQLNPLVRERYAKTLASLEPLAQLNLDQGMAREVSTRTHLFLVPCKTQTDCLNIEQYNPKISRSIREGLGGLLATDNKRKTLAKTLLESPGPFLVSSVKPLGAYQPAEKPLLLFIDFSSLPTECITSTIEKYRNYFNFENVVVQDVTNLKKLGLTCSVRGAVRAIFDSVPVAVAKAKPFLK